MTYNLKAVVVAIASVVFFASCEEEEVNPTGSGSGSLETKYAVDIIADTGDVGKYTFYSLSENKVIDAADSATTKWDLAFKGTSVLTNGGTSGPGNGGAIIKDGIFSEFTSAPSTGYSEDGSSGLAIPTGSGNGWYTYTSTNTPSHAILPIAGKVIMIRTADGKYAKVEIQSYYQGKPNTTTAEFADLNTRPESRFYNFQFVYQPDGTTNF